VPIYREPIAEKQNKNKSARTAALSAMPLPFWDDFSFHLSQKYYPNDTMWVNVNSRSVWVNSGVGIKPPSINVATFDGYDSLGKPYSVNDVLAKGFADNLTSRPLRLADVPIASRQGDVFISFFYQFKGNGDAPETGDNLSLSFKNRKGQWIKAWSTEEVTIFKPDTFVQVVRSISDTSFFHNDFQFRFQNFGRLSGPFDTWNLDYVYVNFQPFKKKSESFPDRALATPLTSIFQSYWSVPIKHFSSTQLKYPKYGILNLYNDDKDGYLWSLKDSVQSTVPFISRTSIISNFKDGVSIKTPIVSLVDNTNSQTIPPFKYRTGSFTKLPNSKSINLSADSVKIKISLRLNSRDDPTDTTGYVARIFKPIDFRSNDTTSTTFILKDYYAYDDGVAEYGAKITGRGTQLAYQYDMLTTTGDTIIAVDVYFPRFGDNTSQTVQLFVMDTLTGNASDFVYKQSIPVTRKARDAFYRAEISAGAAVKGRFYIGWELNSDASIPVGFDRNTDSSDKMFVRTLDNGVWLPNLTEKGSFMMRPVFGNTKEKVITNVEYNKSSKPYPNPTQHSFFLPADAQQIQLYDIAGRQIAFEQNDQFDKKEIKITTPTSGLYLVRYFDKKWCTEKIMVIL
jgi:Secretion system C-terminal sorting domain